MFDLPLHLRGALELPPGAEAADALGSEHGYQHLEELRRMPDGLREFTLDTGGETRILLRFLDEAQVFSAAGLGYTPREKLPVLLRRAEGRAACFAASYNLDEDEAVEVRVETGPPVAVDFGGYRFELGGETAVIDAVTGARRVLAPGGGP